MIIGEHHAHRVAVGQIIHAKAASCRDRWLQGVRLNNLTSTTWILRTLRRHRYFSDVGTEFRMFHYLTTGEAAFGWQSCRFADDQCCPRGWPSVAPSFCISA